MRWARAGIAGAVLMAFLAVATPSGAGSASAGNGRGADPGTYWSPARMAAATPRELVVDERGLGYLRRPDGSLQPHGHSARQLWASPAPASRPTPGAKPGGSDDTTGPVVTNRDPAPGATIDAAHSFKATVTDPSGVKSVSFVIIYPNGTQTQSFSASGNGDVWTVNLQGFTAGDWAWYVVAKDKVRGGNVTTSATTGFTVSGTGGGGTGGGSGGTSTVTNAPWDGDGPVQTAAGRIYFEMPANPKATRWNGYVCSGTVAQEGTTDRSVIITAAHCVYDDVYKAFARNVLFIPNQAATTGAGTDRNCSNDPMGCWSPSFGVVDTRWTNRTFPANIPWDYAYYVVPDSGAHTGTSDSSEALDSVAGSLAVQFTPAPTTGALTHALGYSYSDDPNFMYCAEGLATENSYGDWWLGQCGLSGGSSGGPWVQPLVKGNGPIVSVNSWGYTNQPGMAGPRLVGTSAGCLFAKATAQSFTSVTNRGIHAVC